MRQKGPFPSLAAGARMPSNGTASSATALVPQHAVTALAVAGRVANEHAQRHVFDDYRARKATNTLNAQRNDLETFSHFLSLVHDDTAPRGGAAAQHGAIGLNHSADSSVSRISSGVFPIALVFMPVRPR